MFSVCSLHMRVVMVLRALIMEAARLFIKVGLRPGIGLWCLWLVTLPRCWWTSCCLASPNTSAGCALSSFFGKVVSTWNILFFAAFRDQGWNGKLQVQSAHCPRWRMSGVLCRLLASSALWSQCSHCREFQNVLSFSQHRSQFCDWSITQAFF